MDTKYILHIHTHSPFPCAHPLPLVPNPRKYLIFQISLKFLQDIMLRKPRWIITSYQVQLMSDHRGLWRREIISFFPERCRTTCHYWLSQTASPKMKLKGWEQENRIRVLLPHSISRALNSIIRERKVNSIIPSLYVRTRSWR
jgi:hypothetical protein